MTLSKRHPMTPSHVETEHSLWLTFDGDADEYRQLREAIADLADTYEDAPVFDPHVTLRGGLTGDRTALAETTRELAETPEPLDIAFGDVQCSTTAHQCVFLLVTPTLELLRLRRQSTAAFDRDEETYVPHLSLLYGELSIERRVALAEAIDTSALPERGRCTAITLVDTTGPVREWESVRSVRL